MAAARAFIETHPALAALLVHAAAGILRLTDIFVLKLDERVGEIILSKAGACILLAGFMSLAGANLGDLGLRAQGAVSSLLIGTGITLAALAIGYAVECRFIVNRGQTPSFLFAGIDPKSGLAGGVAFAALLLFGNFVNSAAEEGLFRGLLIPTLGAKSAMLWGILSSAFLFGAWHLPWAVKSLISGQTTPWQTLLVANFVPQFLLGLVWGYLFFRTGSLWGCLVSHTLTNSAVNFLHVKSGSAINADLPARMGAFTVVMLLSGFVIALTASALKLPAAERWGA